MRKEVSSCHGYYLLVLPVRRKVAKKWWWYGRCKIRIKVCISVSRDPFVCIRPFRLFSQLFFSQLQDTT